MADPRIVVHPSLGYGKPYLEGCGVLSEVIYGRLMGGEFAPAIALDYDLELLDLRAVFAFERWCRRRGRYDAPYAERLARERPEAGGWPRQVWPRRGQ
jgi:uncharacterized protein (DUF433 family)